MALPVSTHTAPPVASLTHADVQAILAILPCIYRAMDLSTFPAESLRVLLHLFPTATFCSYNEIDLSSGSARVFYEPAEVEGKAECLKPKIWEFREQHPLMQRYERGEDSGVVKISDYVSPEEWHQTDIFRMVLAPMGLEDTLSFTLQGTRTLKVFYAINGPKRFTERDRAVGASLQPHLVQAFANAVAFTEARALALVSASLLSESGEHGVMLVDQRGRIIHANDRAALHLGEACARSDGEWLPAPLAAWSKEQPQGLDQPMSPLEISGSGATFLFRAAQMDEGHVLVVSRRSDEKALCLNLAAKYQVTERQAGVLLWLARGKTNSEIAKVLGLSERTVEKHLQNIFDRLGVENRHNATLKTLAVIGG